MPEIIDSIDRFLRRNPSIPRLELLRTVLRKPYHHFIGLQQAGLPLTIGGSLPVRLPAEFCAKELENYEKETVCAIHQWVKENPGGVFVDIGCSYGYFSCGVLFADQESTVIAIDADLPSLAISRHVCKHALHVEERLTLFHTLVGPDSESSLPIKTLRDLTAKKLIDAAKSLDPQKTNYVNLDTKVAEEDLPRVSVDTLIAETLSTTKKQCLLKIDVEGAEQIVLEGAHAILREHHPTLIVSVHPPFLPKYGGSRECVRTLLESYGYAIEIIAVDHEEHWLAT